MTLLELSKADPDVADEISMDVAFPDSIIKMTPSILLPGREIEWLVP